MTFHSEPAPDLAVPDAPDEVSDTCKVPRESGGRESDNLYGVLAEHPAEKPEQSAPPAPRASRVGHRGFASMDKARLREIASRGGKLAHARGTAHEFTSETGKEAGAKGGNRVSEDRAHMSRIGKLGVIEKRKARS